MKTHLINEVRNLLSANNAPPVLVFRTIDDDNTAFEHKGAVYTKQQCRSIPCRMRIIVIRECRRREQA